MSEPLTLPGTIPGLLRRCSPVVYEAVTWEDCGGTPTPTTVRAVVAYVDEERAHVVYEDCGVTVTEDDVPLADLDLDLEDVTGRDHADLWLRGHDQHTHLFWWIDRPGQTFAGLDRHDNTLLPDGTLWVDAEAIRRLVVYAFDRMAGLLIARPEEAIPLRAGASRSTKGGRMLTKDDRDLMFAAGLYNLAEGLRMQARGSGDPWPDERVEKVQTKTNYPALIALQGGRPPVPWGAS